MYGMRMECEMNSKRANERTPNDLKKNRIVKRVGVFRVSAEGDGAHEWHWYNMFTPGTTHRYHQTERELSQYRLVVLITDCDCLARACTNVCGRRNKE